MAAYYPAESRMIFANSRGRHSNADCFPVSRKLVARTAAIDLLLAQGRQLSHIFKALYIVEITTTM